MADTLIEVSTQPCLACPFRPRPCQALVFEGPTALWRGQNADLTMGELRVLTLLSAIPGRLYTYREIYDALWHKGFHAGSGIDGYRNNVRSMIKRVRSKFKRIDPTFDMIYNHSSYGYGWRKD